MILLSTQLGRLAAVNLLTLGRLFAGLSAIFIFPKPNAGVWLLALFAFILISDIMDGALARRWKVVTVAGSIFDYTVDYFNSYLQIALLVSVGVPVAIFIPYMLRDLLYIFWRVYVPEERESGIVSLSILGTLTVYFYVLAYAFGYAPNMYANLALLVTYLISCLNLLWRFYRSRRPILEKIRSEFSN